MKQNSEADVRKQEVVPAQAPGPSPFGPLIEPAATNGKQPFVLKAEKEDLSKSKSIGVLLMGAAVGVVAILLVITRIPHPATPTRTAASVLGGSQKAEPTPQPTPSASGLPLNDSVATRTQNQVEEKEGLGPDDVAHTAQPRSQPQPAPINLAAVKPPWEAPNYRGDEQNPETDDELAPSGAEAKAERDALDKPSLVFVESRSPITVASNETRGAGIDIGIGLPPGTRLRARLESAVNTAVAIPAVAVVEYNYERHGEIVVPAGTRVFGHLEAADSSGFVGVRFDSMTMPDGSQVGVEAAATDLQFRPLRGRVEGRHRGKNILVRSVSGVGQIAATLAGRGSLNQPLSQGDLLRERVSDNIAQASDQEVNRLAVTERLVVSVAANTEIYVVLQKPAKARLATPPMEGGTARDTGDQLRQLLQLQKELNQQMGAPNSNQ